MNGRAVVTVLAVAVGLIAAAPSAADTPAPPVPPRTPQWRVQPTPLPDYGDGGAWQDGSFSAVSCPTTTTCLALGGGTFQAPESLGGWWNGTSWSLDGTSISGLVDNQGIDSPSISCVSVKRCYTVVNAADINTQIAGYAVWNGQEWSSTNDLPGEKQGDQLNAISCPSNKFCMAVGQIGGDTLFALAYNGRRWRRVPLPASRAQTLNGVACPAANACFAVGPSPGKPQLGLIERWDGQRWRAQRVPIDTGARRIGLNDVSCSAQNACVAVGVYTDLKGNGRAFALGWDGSRWRRLPMTNTSGTLVSVSCPASGTCVAVGSQARHPVARVWNGTSWSLQPIPNGAYAGLASVSCATASYCMTVGTEPGGVAPFAASYY